MIDRLRALLSTPRRRALALGAAAAVVLVLVAVLAFVPRGADEDAALAPIFSVSPSGEDVSRLAPVRVTYEAAPEERDGSRLLRLEPPIPGEYLWLNPRTLLFQPEYPGYQRGRQYEIHLEAVQEAGLPAARVERFTATGALRVVQVIPEDREMGVVAGTPILVQFSRGVAPLTTLSETARAKPVLIFDPPLPGRGEWVNTGLYRYTPDSLPPNRQYKVRLEPALSAAADGQLSAPFEWSFETYGPAVNKITPEPNAQFAAPDQAITVEFNMPMDRAAVERGFSLKDAGGASAGGTFSWRDGDRTAVFQPARLGPRATYTAEIAAGIPSPSGGALARGVTTSFTTVGPVELLRTTPSDGGAVDGFGAIRLTFSNPLDIESFEGRVSITGIPTSEIRVYPSGNGEILIGQPMSLRASSSYTLRIAAGAKDRYGQAVPPVELRFTTPALPPSVSLMIPGHVGQYSTAEAQRLYFTAMNTDEVTFRLYSVPPAQFGELMRRSFIPGNYAWNLPNPLREWKETVRADRDQAYVASTAISAGGSLPKGLYALIATLPSGTQRAEFVFSVVDTAIVTKSAHDELLVWVLDLASGTPVANTAVRLLDGPGGSQTTDGNGLAKIPRPKRLAYVSEESWLVEVTGGGRFGVSKLGWQTHPSVAREPWGRDYVAHLYTDRVIYRPGETVELKGVVRTDDDAAYRVPGGDQTWDLEVRGPQFDVLSTQKVKVNEFGTFALSHTLPAGARLGDYRFLLRGSGNARNAQIASASVGVIEFRKPEFEVAMTAPPHVVAGDPLSLELRATYLFGGGLAGAPIRWQATSAPGGAGFGDDLRGYSFGDFDVFRQSVIAAGPIASGEAVTDADGLARLSVPTSVGAASSPRRVTVSASVSDQTIQAQSTTASLTVFPADVVPGVRPDRYVARTGEAAQIAVVTVRPDGSRYAGRPVTVRVYERTWVTTKERGADGGRYYNSTPVDTLVATEQVTTDSRGDGSVPFTPRSSGALRIVAEVTDDRGRSATAATMLYVAGPSNASWRYSNDERFEMVADQASYRVGDTVQLLIPAPYPGATGLVTIERGKNIRQTVMRFDTNTVVLPIPIGEDAVPNIFVSVVLYRAPSASDPAPRYNVSTIDLPVSTATRALTVKIATDRDRATPRDRVRYQVNVTDSAGRPVAAEVSLALVDKAVILLAEDRGPTGLLAFWFQRGLGVNTASSLLVMMERLNDAIRGLIGEGTTKGGDGFAEGDPRRDFRNTAFWQAQVRTNDRGEASVEIPLPDNVTTWRMQARAVTADARVGESVHELLTTTPLIVRPALPRFVRVGDRIDARVVVQNGGTTALDTTVTVTAQGATIANAQPVRLRVEAGRSAVAMWPATAAASQNAVFTFSAAGANGTSDSVETTIPVYAAYTPETVATGGIVADEPMLEAVYLPPDTDLADGALAVAMRQTLAATLAEELARFPRLASESTDYVTARLRTRLGVLEAEQTPIAETRVAEDVTAVLGRQAGDGGFVACSICGRADPDTTARALIALGDAKSLGANVPDDRFNRGRAYLRRVLDAPTDVERPMEPARRAMYLHAIARAGGGAEIAGVIRSMWDADRSRLHGSGLAYLLMAMDEADVRDAPYTSARSALIASAVQSANGAHWEDELPGGRSGAAVLATSAAVEALSRTSPQPAILRSAETWLGLARAGLEYEWSWQTGQYARAIGSMAGGGSGARRAQDYSVRLDANSVLSGRLDPAAAKHSAATLLPLTSLTPGKVNVLEFSRPGGAAGQLLYTTLLRYQMPAREAEALNRGFAVTREITPVDAPGTRIHSTGIGTTVRVKITVVVSSQQLDVEITDPLPAGLEAIDPKLRTADAALVSRMRAEQRSLNQASGGYAAPWMRWYYSPWDYNQVRDDRIQVYARSLPKGVHEFVYFARATTAGTFLAPPTLAQVGGMPDVFGRGDSESFTVQP